MTSLYCNGKKLTPFEFNDYDAEAKSEDLFGFPVVTATAMTDADNSDVSD